MAEELVETKSQGGEGRKDSAAGICGICPGGCGVNVQLADGKIEKISPLENHPMGVVCVRGAHAKEIVYSPDRLKYPLLRVGERGEGKFERITWDEALDRIAEKFQAIKRQYGPEAVMTYFGRGLFDLSLLDVFSPRGVYLSGILGVLFPFGSPNVATCSSVCYVAYGQLAAIPTIGSDMQYTYPDFASSNLIVIWGANPPTDSPPDKMKKILDARRRGARVVVIDHMRTEMANKADQWIGVRSGTDGALALSIMNVIINEELYNREFVVNWTVGFEELRAYVQQYPPEVAEKITRVPKETIVELAREIAQANGASLVMYTGLEYTNSGVQNIRAVLCLWAITGNIDAPGGLLFRPRNPAKFGRITVDLPAGVKPIGADKYPMCYDMLKSAQFMEAPRAILEGDPYPVRALLVGGASIITNLPNPDIWRRCFKALDFLVVFDRFMTADAMYADIVLPATTYFENESYQRYAGGYLQWRRRIVEPVGEARSNFQFLTGLAKRLGYGDMFPQTEEEHLQLFLKDSPFTLSEFRAHPEGVRHVAGQQEYRKYARGLLRSGNRDGFNTPSGKVELVSSVLQKYGYDGLPAYVEPKEGPLGSPELYKQFPLVLNTGARLQSAFRSQHLNIKGLLKLQPRAQVLINPVDAQARGLADSDSVWVESPRGRVGVWARVTDDVMTGQVELNVGGGSPIHAEGWRDSNANYVTDLDNRDPISGFPVYKALLCEISRRDS